MFLKRNFFKKYYTSPEIAILLIFGAKIVQFSAGLKRVKAMKFFLGTTKNVNKITLLTIENLSPLDLGGGAGRVPLAPRL